MKYYAVCNKGCIVTDDYSAAEIKEKKHIKHLIDDFKEINYTGIVRVFDFNDRFVCKLKNGMVYR